MVAQDQYQGAADGILAQRLGVKKVYILNDKEAYGLGVASNFRHAAQKLRITVAGFEALDPKASSYEALASKIKGSGATGVFIGSLVCENGGKLIKDLRTTLGPNVKLILPDGFTPISAVVEGAGAAAENAYVSVAGLPNSKLTGQGKAFLVAFTKANKKVPGSVLGLRCAGDGRNAQRDRPLERQPGRRDSEDLHHEPEGLHHRQPALQPAG